MIRVLVVEDSITARELLVEILRSDPEIHVVGEASNGLEAVEMTERLRPNVITMDISMPKMDGFEATREIMSRTPTPIVIVSVSCAVREVETSMQALRAGALTILPKPSGVRSPTFDEECLGLRQTVRAMSQVKVVRRWRERSAARSLAALPLVNGARLRVVAIAASTGGPAATARILADLPRDFPVPILLAQHIALGFGQGLAAWLNTTGSLRVKVAEDGERLAPGVVYVAPDDCHLGVRSPNAIALSRSAPIGGFRPSGTFLFDSVARVFGKSAVAVILTGMGNDGVEGLRAVREYGGRVIAQNEETSVVFGMPQAAISAGLADVTAPLDAIAAQLRDLAARSRGSV